MSAEAKLAARGFVLPPPLRVSGGPAASFTWARRHGDRLYLSGHGPQAPDGSLAGPFGRVPSEVSLDDARTAATRTALSMLATIKRTLGDLDEVAAWLAVHGVINADPGFERTTAVLDPFSAVILDLYGPEAGSHARSATGATALPLNVCLVVSAECALR